MILTLNACFVIAVLLACAIALRLKLIFNSGRQTPETGEMGERPTAFYQPLDRLLDETDLQFLSRQRGVDPATLNRVRRMRRRIYRQYLSALAIDFSYTTAQIRALMVNSDHSRGDLAHILLHARKDFTLGLIQIEAKLLLHACGWHRGGISASALTSGLLYMRIQLDRLASAPTI